MRIINQLRSYVGGLWTGVETLDSFESDTGHAIRFCEAMMQSFHKTMILPSHEFSCPGARRSFGLDKDDEALSLHIYHETGIPAKKALGILSGRPRLEKPTAAVLMGGDIEAPDVFLGCLQPAAAMELLRIWQSRFGVNLELSISTFLAICSCVADAMLTRRLLFSLGCPNSRDKEGVPPNALIAVLPVELAEALLGRRQNYANV